MSEPERHTRPVSELPCEVRVRVFGGLRVARAGVDLPLGPPRQQMLLAMLVAACGTAVSVSELVDAVWAQAPPASANNQLQRLVGEIRRLFEPGLATRSAGAWLSSTPRGYRLITDAADCDLNQFVDLVSRARAAAAADAVHLYSSALELAAETPFAGLDEAMLGMPAFVALARERISVAVEGAELMMGSAATPVRTVSVLQQVAASAPVDERLQAALMRLLAVTGRRPEALALYQRTRLMLVDELGIDPGRELLAAHRDVLGGLGEAEAASNDPTLSDGSTYADSVQNLRPAQLPPRVLAFIDRPALSTMLDEQFEEIADGGSAMQITALGGMGGVGKTALAVAWAHRHLLKFPDGQLYVNLRGFDPGGRVVQASEALNALLVSLGVNLSALSDDSLEGRAALFRSVVAHRRMLILLDNARDSEQIRPLLPGTGSCAVIVTSRNRLTSLIAHEGARSVPLDRLTDSEARALLVKRLGSTRVDGDSDAVDIIVRSCAGLPLALAVTAARCAVDPSLTLKALADELGAAGRGRLDALSTGEVDDDLRSAFAASYQALSATAASLFRLLAVHPGPQISLDSLASIAGVPREFARSLVNELVTANMCTPVSPGRYILHDLLRVYAGEMLDLTGDRAAAELRLIEHYLRTARSAWQLFGRPPIVELDRLDADVQPESIGSIAQALAWYARERAVLDAVIRLAFDRGRNREGVLILLDVRPMYEELDLPRDALPLTLRALDAAADLAEPVLQAEALRTAGVRMIPFDVAAAERLYLQAADISEASGNLAGLANTLRNLADLHARGAGGEMTREYILRAVDAARRCGRDDLLTVCLADAGSHVYELGDWNDAVVLLQEALLLSEKIGIVILRPNIALYLAQCWTSLEHWERVAEISRWGLAQMTEGQHEVNRVQLYGALARAAWRQGNAELADEAARSTRALIRVYDADRIAGDIGRRLADKFITGIEPVLTAVLDSA